MIGRALRWQIAKAVGASHAVVTYGPMRLLCRPGHSYASSVLYFGLPEWDDMCFVLWYLAEGDLFVDVGANVGVYSLLAKTAVPRCGVIAVEPDLDARECLRENSALSGASVEEIREVALGEVPGPAPFTSGLDTVNRLAGTGEPGTTTVEVRTLDDVLAGRIPALVKIDVEGAELAVLRGGRRTLEARPGPVVLLEINRECYRFGSSPMAISDHLARLGYSLYEFTADRARLVPYSTGTLPRTGNVIAARDRAAVEARLAAGRALRDPRKWRVGVRIGFREPSDAVHS